MIRKSVKIRMLMLITALAVLTLAACSINTKSEPISNYEHPEAPELSQNVQSKQQNNTDSVGWIMIDGTDIDAVVLQNPDISGGNDYYLTHDFFRNEDKDGAFCTDRRWGLEKGLPRNTTIYGHSWSDDPDGPLFQQTKRYFDSDFAKSHPYINFSTAEADMIWEVFAVSFATKELPYIQPDLSWSEFEKVIDVICQSSLYDYNAEISKDDKILTISTCTYSVPGNEDMPLSVNKYRYVIMAKLVSPDTPLHNEAVFVQNENILEPDRQPAINIS